MNYQNLSFLQDLFLQTQNICSWSMTLNMQLLYTNCPEADFFFDLFSVSPCPEAISGHFRQSLLPVVATDRIGFVWIAAMEQKESSDSVPVIHMLGPVFTSQMTVP